MRGADSPAHLLTACGEGQNTRFPLSFTGVGNFTGAFVGMAANDVGSLAMPADFSYFSSVNL